MGILTASLSIYAIPLVNIRDTWLDLLFVVIYWNNLLVHLMESFFNFDPAYIPLIVVGLLKVSLFIEQPVEV